MPLENYLSLKRKRLWVYRDLVFYCDSVKLKKCSLVLSNVSQWKKKTTANCELNFIRKFELKKQTNWIVKLSPPIGMSDNFIVKRDLEFL